MNINITSEMNNSFKSMNLLKKVGLSLFVIMIVVYLILSLNFIFS
jgi:hypothetical protein